MATIIWNKSEYKYFYTAEDGDYYIPKVVVHGGEPWLKLMDETLYSLWNGIWSKVDDECWEVR